MRLSEWGHRSEPGGEATEGVCSGTLLFSPETPTWTPVLVGIFKEGQALRPTAQLDAYLCWAQSSIEQFRKARRRVEQ
jgi:hypothetical protein